MFKRIISDLSFTKKIVLLMIIPVISMIIIIGMFFSGFSSQKKLVNTLYISVVPMMQKAYTANVTINEFQVLISDAKEKLSFENENRLSFTVALTVAKKRLSLVRILAQEMEKILSDRTDNKEELKLLAGIINKIETINNLLEKLYNNSSAQEQLIIMENLKELRDEYILLSTQLDYIIEMEKALISRSQTEFDRKMKTFIYSVTVLFLISVSATVVFGGFIVYFSVGPIKRTSLILNDVAEGEGDLTTCIDVFSNDEIGKMAVNFNKFVDKIHKIIKETKEISDDLIASSSEMSATTVSFSENILSQAATTEQITSTMEMINNAIVILSENSNEQFSELNYLISQIDDLSKIIEKTGVNIKDSNIKSNDIFENLKEKEESLKAMQMIMKTISDSSIEMKSIIKIIRDISDQINLLSLNASIEAARAGDAGKGFAVVANEVSKLADETAESLNEISELVQENERDINSALLKTDEISMTITDVINGVGMIRGMNNNISDLMQQQINTNKYVTATADVVKKKTSVVQEYLDREKTAMSETLESIVSINELTQSNSAGAEEMAATAESISTIVNNLKEKVNFFKV